MGAEENGLALQELAQRLETLERENAELRSKVATLEGSGTTRLSEVPALRGSERRRDKADASAFVKQVVSRRSLLRRVGAAAVAAVAAGALLDTRQAKAHNDNTVISPGAVNTHWVQALNHVDSGAAMYGEGWTGVWGRSSQTGESGVYGQHTANGTGVEGESAIGYGGVFKGGKAQLRLLPGNTVGAPTGAHSKGEVYMDRAASLWVCVRGGNPATWRKVTTTAS